MLLKQHITVKRTKCFFVDLYYGLHDNRILLILDLYMQVQLFTAVKVISKSIHCLVKSFFNEKNLTAKLVCFFDARCFVFYI